MSTGLFEQLQALLPVAIPPIPVVLAGSRSAPVRRVYASPAQYGTGSGPFENVVDAKWSGTVQCEVPVAGIAFMEFNGRTYWAKSAPAAFDQPFSATLTGFQDYSYDRATFSAGLGESWLPGVPVSVTRDLEDRFEVALGPTSTGVPHCICKTPEARFYVVLVQQALARTGRCRLWRLRRPAAALLPPDLQRLFTQRRSGTWTASNSSGGA